MNRRWTNAAVVGAAALALVAGATTARAQSGKKDEPEVKPTVQPASPKKTKSVRKSVVDLEQMAKDRRPGQVMPGDPAPMGAAAPKVDVLVPTPAAANTEAPAVVGTTDATAATGGKPVIPLPNTAPFSKPVLKPTTDAAMRDMNTKPVVDAAPATTTNEAPMTMTTEAKALENAPMAAKDIGAAGGPGTPIDSHAKPGTKPSGLGGGEVPLVDGSVISALPSTMGSGPAKVHVESVAGDAGSVQWKTLGGAWHVPTVGESVESVVEVRAGLDAELVLLVDDRVQVRVSRLGRAQIERALETGGLTTVSVTVSRGAVEVRSVGGTTTDKTEWYARVRTPDQNFGLVGPLRVEYDAFSGTRRRVVNP